ncbi:MAG TPA: NnrS family protein [Kiritimatiellia bacterium]|nr:NnrS family protein [Kiritimatiellia bacterium]
MNAPARVRWRDAEPYRLLFLLGAWLGVAAVALWPLFVYGAIKTYPGVAHARVMIEGFAACFVLGFLGTALPHMLEAPRFTFAEVLVLLAGLFGASALHFAALHPAGDMVFAATLLFFIAGAGWRAARRKDRPPPGLFAVLLGLLCAVCGALAQALYPWTNLPPFVHPFSKLLLYQGFLLLPVLGVGAYILPVFVGYPRRQSPVALAQAPRAWEREAAALVLFAVGLLASFAMEALGQARGGYAVRLALLCAFLFRSLPVHRRQQNPGAMAWITRLALLALPVGYACLAAWPSAPLAWLHIVFISGLGWLILSVATRVIVAHGGFQHLFGARWPMLWWVFGLVTLAMATRVSADWMPDSRFNHYAYAALSWIAGVLLWLGAMRRFLFAADPAASGPR